jgi:hypothetical protein
MSGERIVKAFAAEVIVNVGDILPPTGDIEQVIALGEAVRGTALRGGAAAMRQKPQ